MVYNDKEPLNKELLAELLLSTYFPEVSEWNAHYGSFFSRNYTGDLREVSEESHTVSLSRNGLYDILPEKMFFDPEDLRFREPRDFALRLEELYEEEKNIKDYFMPLDSYLFNQSHRLHKIMSHMMESRTSLLLKLLFDYDIEGEENEYVKLMAPLLLKVTEIRADLDLLKNVLSEVLGCFVDFSMPHQDVVLFVVHKRGLNSRDYLKFMNDLKPLFEFVQYWFIPMEIDCHYKVKDYQQVFVLSVDRALVLDYNTQI